MAEPTHDVNQPRRGRLTRFTELGRNFRYALSYSWGVSRIRTAAVVSVPLAESLLPVALALVLRGLVNATLTAGDATGWSVERYVLLSLVLSLGLVVSQSLKLYLSDANTEALEHRMSLDLMAHADRLDFAYFEQPDSQDTLNQVRITPGHHTHEMVAKCVHAVALLITLTTLLGLLATIEPLLLAYLIPLAVPYLWYRSWVAKTRFEVRFAQNRSRRWIDYYTRQVMTDEALPEVRALDIGALLQRRVSDRLATIRSENHRSFQRELFGSSAFNSIAILAIHAALLSSANKAAAGDLTAGDIAVFAGATTGLRSSIDAFVAGIGSLRWHLSHIDHLRAFFALTPAPRRPATVAARAATDGSVDASVPLELRDVEFRYASGSAPVLDGVSFTVGKGETVGLVGRNGSGKSTIVKLVNGLYATDAGSIRLAGVPVVEATPDFLHTHVSTVFQTFGRYNASALENIAWGDWRALLDDPDRVAQIAARVGLTDLIDTLPEGYDTTLGRMFGDVSISGGQWQMFAIARAFARDTPLMILDEPTANLDPETEFEVFERFKELAADRATLLISHRFSTLALADRIVVLNSGRTEEQGTHDELIAGDGTYAHLYRLFRTQGETGVWNDGSADA